MVGFTLSAGCWNFFYVPVSGLGAGYTGLFDEEGVVDVLLAWVLLADAGGLSVVGGVVLPYYWLPPLPKLPQNLSQDSPKIPSWLSYEDILRLCAQYRAQPMATANFIYNVFIINCKVYKQ